jgi:hypothetical protein
MVRTRTTTYLTVAAVGVSVIIAAPSAVACDFSPTSNPSHVARLQTIAPGVFIDWTFGAASGLGVGIRASYLSHGETFGLGAFTQASWRKMPQIGASTWRVDAGALIAPMPVNHAHAPASCGGTSAIGGTLGGYLQLGGSLHGPTDMAGTTGSPMVGAYAWAVAYVGVSGYFPFFGDSRRRGGEVSISLGLDVPLVIHRTLADGA